MIRRSNALRREGHPLVFLIFFTLLVPFLSASDWPRFRGPNGTGVVDETRLPEAIDRDRNLAWSAKVPKGNSSPIVVGGRVFLTGHEGDERVVLCHDAGDGRPCWRRAVAKARSENFHPRNGPTTPTPASDGRSIFVFFPEIGLLAFSADGEELWRTPLGPFTSVQGLASSPVHVDGKVLLLVDTPVDAHLAAFDARTGRALWKTPRPTGMLGSYATPAVYAPSGQAPQVVVAGAVELTGYDASTGERVWWARGVSAFPTGPPFVVGDSVYTVEPGGGMKWPPFAEPLGLFDADRDGRITAQEAAKDPFWGRSLEGIDQNAGNRDGVVTAQEYASANGGPDDGGLVRLRLGGRGDVRASHLLWRQEKGAAFLTGALLYRDVLYVVHNAILSTYDPADGRVLGQARVKDALGEYWASPVAGDGKIYLANLDGKVSVLQAGRDWRVLSTGDLGEVIVATPAIAGGRVFVRTEGTLFAFAPPSPPARPGF